MALGVTILGIALVHVYFELVLSFSGWTWVGIAYGETYEALVSGLPDALAARYRNLGVRVCNGMGMTETGPTAFLVDPADAVRAGHRLQRAPRQQLERGVGGFIGVALRLPLLQFLDQPRQLRIALLVGNAGAVEFGAGWPSMVFGSISSIRLPNGSST